MNGHAIRELAKAWATVAHDGISRKGAGEPYILHAERVAERVGGWRRKSIAWLHDVIEDAGETSEMRTGMEIALRQIFPGDIIDDVRMLSRLPDTQGKKQPYQEWITDIAASGNQDVIAVKLADIEDNLHDLSDIPNSQGLEKRYLKAKIVLMEAVK